MPRMRVPFPVGGVSKNLPETDQPPLTCPEAFNVRGIDPATGRTRGASRSGMRRIADLGKGPVQQVASLVYNNNRTTFTELQQPVLEWANLLNADTLFQTSRSIAVDSVGNVYVTQGDSQLAKYNSEGVEVWRIEVPLTATGQSVGPVVVDGFGNIYVGIADGPTNLAGAVVAFNPGNPDDGDEEPTQKWTEDLEGYCVDLRLYGAQLFVLENRANQSYLRSWSNIRTAGPFELWSKAVPNPASAIDVNAAGEVFVACPANPDRGVITDAGVCTDPQAIDWTPRDLGADGAGNEGIDRLWSWHDASQIPGLSTGDLVFFWEDLTGNRRDFFDPFSVNPDLKPPKYQQEAICGRPAIRFTAEDATALLTDVANGQDDDANKSLMPGTVGSKFTMFIIARVPDGGPVGTLFSHYGDNNAWHRVSFVNNITNASPPVLEEDLGEMLPLIRPVDDGGGAGAILPLSIDTENDSSVQILAYRFDGKGTAGDDNSTLRNNGTVTDNFTVLSDRTAARSALGVHTTFAAYGHLDCDVAEIIVVNGELDYDSDPTVDCDLKKIEGYLAHKYGMQHLLPPTHLYRGTPPSGSGVEQDTESELAIRSTDGILAKYAAQRGSLRWARAGAGYGVGVAVGTERRVFSVGVGATGSAVTTRCVIDEGATPSLDVSDGAWTREDAPPTIDRLRLAVDRGGSLYVPVHDPEATTTLRRIAKDGDLVSEFTATGAIRAVGVAIPGNYPDEDLDTPERVLVACDPTYQVGAQTTGQSVLSVQLVESEVEPGNPREKLLLAVAGGQLCTLDKQYAASVPTGGASLFDSSSPWVRMQEAYGQVFMLDGERYAVFDPEDAMVEDWESQSAGSIPERCKILCLWNGRVFLARGDSPHNWFMSKVGNPYNWDFFPAVRTSDQAIEGASSRAGLFPDILNAAIPYSDDLLIMGGDHSIYRMTGDPADSGRIDLVTDETGVAFGSPWCKDPSGRLYFLGSRGGVYVMGGGSAPQSLTVDTLDFELKDIDLSAFTARMVYDTRLHGFHLLFVPIGSLNTVEGTIHYFFDTKNRAWWPDTFSNSGLQPLCACVSDGDSPDDRQIIVGCADGRLRAFDRLATSDDGYLIDSSVVVGPLRDRQGRAARFSNPIIELDPQYGGITAKLYGSSRNSIPPRAKFETKARVESGTNRVQRIGVRGESCWMLLCNASTSERWSIDEMSIDAAPAGRSAVHG
ncbi:MAG: hypothetical protein ABL309_13805 [Phycisphaerales bacterium]